MTDPIYMKKAFDAMANYYENKNFDQEYFNKLVNCMAEDDFLILKA